MNIYAVARRDIFKAVSTLWNDVLTWSSYAREGKRPTKIKLPSGSRQCTKAHAAGPRRRDFTK